MVILNKIVLSFLALFILTIITAVPILCSINEYELRRKAEMVINIIFSSCLLSFFIGALAWIWS